MQPVQSAPFLASNPQNRHRIFPYCTPRKSPKWPALPATVTQSRRRPLAPTLSPALFSHPPLAAQCLGYVRCPPSSPSLSAERRKIPFSIEGYPMPQIVAFAGPAGPAFSFSAFLLTVVLPPGVEGLAFSHPGSPLFWIRSQLGSHWPNRACLGFRWCRFLTWLSKSHTGPHRGESGFTAFFPSLSRWKPGKQQICVHGNLPGAQSQDENLIGKKRFSLPWLSLASPPHFFSRPPSHFSNSVLRSLFFVYSTANFEAAYP